MLNYVLHLIRLKALCMYFCDVLELSVGLASGRGWMLLVLWTCSYSRYGLVLSLAVGQSSRSSGFVVSLVRVLLEAKVVATVDTGFFWV